MAADAPGIGRSREPDQDRRLLRPPPPPLRLGVAEAPATRRQVLPMRPTRCLGRSASLVACLQPATLLVPGTGAETETQTIFLPSARDLVPPTKAVVVAAETAAICSPRRRRIADCWKAAARRTYGTASASAAAAAAAAALSPEAASVRCTEVPAGLRRRLRLRLTTTISLQALLYPPLPCRRRFGAS